MTVEELLTRAEEINDWLNQGTHGLPMEGTDRSRLWGACFDLVQEHARATLPLVTASTNWFSLLAGESDVRDFLSGTEPQKGSGLEY